MILYDEILFELYGNNNCTIDYTDIAAISPLFECGGEVMAVDYINMIYKMAAGGKSDIKANFHQIFQNIIALHV